VLTAWKLAILRFANRLELLPGTRVPKLSASQNEPGSSERAAAGRSSTTRATPICSSQDRLNGSTSRASGARSVETGAVANSNQSAAGRTLCYPRAPRPPPGEISKRLTGNESRISIGCGMISDGCGMGAARAAHASSPTFEPAARYRVGRGTGRDLVYRAGRLFRISSTLGE